MENASIITFKKRITKQQKELITSGTREIHNAIEAYEKEDIKKSTSLINNNDILEFKDINSYVMRLDETQREILESDDTVTIEQDSYCTLQDTSNAKLDLYDHGYIQALQDIGDSTIVKKSLRSSNDKLLNNTSKRKNKKRDKEKKFAHLYQIKAPKAWTRVKGKGVKLAVLDTGVDGLHNDLRVVEGVSFVSDHNNTLDHSQPWHDDNNHGTQCAGIIAAMHGGIPVYGIAPEVDLYAVKVLDSQTRGNKSRIIAGMLWCLDKEIDVVSMSIAGTPCHSEAQYSAAYQAAAKKLEESGCIVIAAAGNKGRNGVGEPARCPSVMAVTAVDSNNNKLPSASWGPPSLRENQAVEISTPGLNICATAPHSRQENISNTSAACPMVAAAAALIKQMHPTWTPQQIRQHLKDTATPLGTTIKYGTGLLNCKKAVFGY